METDFFGLVMTGGGARGAYQAGVLKRIGELYNGKPSPFPIVAGASAGAINGSMAAAGAADFGRGTARLAELWHSIEPKQIFRSDIGAMGTKATQWITDLSFGGFVGGGRAQSLLDARPLKKLLTDNLPVDEIQKNIDAGHLKALAVVATNYSSGKSFIFIQGQEGHPTWTKSRRVAFAAKITPDHIMASSAIPILFQPVQVATPHGEFYFGDGCLRLTSPLSPAIRLGASKIIAIGIRKRTDVMTNTEKTSDAKSPPVAQVLGVLLNAIFLDHLETDVEHLGRINEMLKSEGPASQIGMKEPVRPLSVLSITPSVDLGALAVQYASQIPTLVRYMLRGLGTRESETSDLMSYLLFVPEYADALLRIGYDDANARIDEIREFLKV